VVLPEPFALHDLRLRATRDRVLPMSVRHAPTPVGAEGG
jgi:hypothetical protein